MSITWIAQVNQPQFTQCMQSYMLKINRKKVYSVGY